MKVIKFGATWCGPCKVYAPIFEQAKAEITDHEFESVDIEDQPDLATKYKITSVPTTLHLDDNDVEIDRISGAISVGKLKQFLEG